MYSGNPAKYLKSKGFPQIYSKDCHDTDLGKIQEKTTSTLHGLKQNFGSNYPPFRVEIDNDTKTVYVGLKPNNLKKPQEAKNILKELGFRELTE